MLDRHFSDARSRNPRTGRIWHLYGESIRGIDEPLVTYELRSKPLGALDSSASGAGDEDDIWESLVHSFQRQNGASGHERRAARDQ